MEQVPHHQDLRVEGIRCARCIYAIESALQEESSIANARVNMSTNRLSIDWNGDYELIEQFIERVKSLGYKVSACETPTTNQNEAKYLLRCVAVAGFSMANIMLLSVALWSSNQSIMGLATRDIFHLLSAAIAIPTILYAGRPFFSSAFGMLKHGNANMDVPISLALILATGMSLFETLNHGEHAYFDSAVMLLFFLLIGRWLDARARGKARENAESLLGLMQGMATIVEDGKTRSIPIKELKEGMVVQIATGETIPTDAIVTSGSSEIDTSLVTGETLPHSVSKDDMVYGGTINISAPIICRVEKASEDSLLADIIRLMEQAEQGRASYVRLADKAAKLYTPVVHTLAAGSFVFWFFIAGSSWQDALLISITTLIITCPCALGLAVPVVQVLASSWLMKRGVLVKTGDALERLAAIDTIVFDKTGTLTEGVPKLNKHDVDSILFALAASLASHSKHPLSIAMTTAYDGELMAVENVEEVAAHGLQGNWQGKIIRLGKRSWCGDSSAPEDELLELWLQVEGDPSYRFTFTDPLRSDAVEVFQRLKALSLHILSGDRASIVQSIGRELGIDKVHAPCLPADKADYLTSLRADGHHVLMVGDGLNDAPALAAANVSISPASAIDIAQNTADMVFQGKQLAPVLWAWNVARFSTRLVKQNFTLAVLYNCFAIPLAVMGYVTPLVAAVAMSSSSLLVILNSFRINLMHSETK